MERKIFPTLDRVKRVSDTRAENVEKTVDALNFSLTQISQTDNVPNQSRSEKSSGFDFLKLFNRLSRPLQRTVQIGVIFGSIGLVIAACDSGEDFNGIIEDNGDGRYQTAVPTAEATGAFDILETPQATATTTLINIPQPTSESTSAPISQISIATPYPVPTRITPEPTPQISPAVIYFVPPKITPTPEPAPEPAPTIYSTEEPTIIPTVEPTEVPPPSPEEPTFVQPVVPIDVMTKMLCPPDLPSPQPAPPAEPTESTEPTEPTDAPAKPKPAPPPGAMPVNAITSPKDYHITPLSSLPYVCGVTNTLRVENQYIPPADPWRHHVRAITVSDGQFFKGGHGLEVGVKKCNYADIFNVPCNEPVLFIAHYFGGEWITKHFPDIPLGDYVGVAIVRADLLNPEADHSEWAVLREDEYGWWVIYTAQMRFDRATAIDMDEYFVKKA